MDNLIRPSARQISAVDIPRAIAVSPAGTVVSSAPPLLEVLWRRRWCVGLCVMLCLAAAATYLWVATPVYRATARISVQPNQQHVLANGQSMPVPPSEGFLQTEADAIQSGPVLNRALEAIGSLNFRTFSDVRGDLVAWLKNGGALKVDVSRKSDVLLISMDSPYPTEAASLVSAIVAAYSAQLNKDKQSNGDEVVRMLQAEHDALQGRRDARLNRMFDLKREKKVLSFKEDLSNPVLERAVTFSRLLTDAQIASIELRSQRDALQGAMTDSMALSTIVESQHMKVKESGDREYDELRSQLMQTSVSLSASQEILGPNHPRVVAARGVIAALQQRIADKERAMVAAQLLAVTTQVKAAEQKEKNLNLAMLAQRDEALDQNPAALEYAKAEAETQQLQKQLELIDSRIAEISVDSMASRPLNVRTIDPARVEPLPVRPAKTLALAAALLAGLTLGAGMAVFRETHDGRLRNPQEILAQLKVPVISTIPYMNPRLSALARGQIVRLDAHSVAAEAYRSVRTTLHLGSAAAARTILVASPGRGDGKSTTASNLAIAFAQSGERTLVIDCDLREPVQHMIFQTDCTSGLTTALSGDTKLADAIRATRVPGVHLLPCGPLPTNPSELLASKRFKRLMQVLSKTFDRIIIDSAPLMRFTDGAILGASADVTLLVLRLNQSMRPLCEAALERLGQVGARVLGTVAIGGSADAAPYYGRSRQYAQPTSAGQLVVSDWSVPDRKVPSRTAAIAPLDPKDGPDFDADPLETVPAHDQIIAEVTAIREAEWLTGT